MDRLTQQIAFVMEIDKLKRVLRQTVLTDKSRQENSAEHSWHLGILALLLAEYANEPVDVAKVVKMVLVHDIIEIDAGDTFAYDEKGYEDKAEREQRAADRIFSLLPADQAAELRSLWDEFEERRSPAARFAAALDRFHPMLHNYHTQGFAWQKNGVTSNQVLARNKQLSEGSETLAEYARNMIADAVAKGYLKP